MSEPVLSVVLCTRNRARLLAGALDSLERQTANPARWEVLVVDNGSSDDTAEVVARRPRARLVREERTGLSHARNRGIREARGEYVAYTDDDCVLPPQWVERLLEVIDREAPDVFGGPYRPFYDSVRPRWFKDEYGSSDRGTEPRRLPPGERLPGCNIVLRRELLEQAGGFDARLGMTGDRIAYAEESEIQDRLRALRPGLDVLYDPSLYVEHLVRPEQMTVRWRLAARFAKGRSAYRASFATVAVDGRAVLLRRLAATAMGALADGLRGLTVRDRRRYPWLANYLCEHTSGYFRSLGLVWAALRDSRTRRGDGGAS